MTRTIQKRADELKPGDILMRNEAFGPAVVCRIEPADVPNRLKVTHFGLLRNDLDCSYYAPDDDKQIEVPDEVRSMAEYAARYRWLCSNNFDRQAVQVHTWHHWYEPHSVTGEPTEWKARVRGGALDEIIDAAMKQEKA